MATTTPNIGLTKPIGSENYSLSTVNNNSDIIDAEITDTKAGSNTRIFKCKNDTSANDNALNVQAGDGRFLGKTAKAKDSEKLNGKETLNVLTSTDTKAPLSAAQGKQLNDTKVSKSGDTINGELTIVSASGNVVLKNPTSAYSSYTKYINNTEQLGYIGFGSAVNPTLNVVNNLAGGTIDLKANSVNGLKYNTGKVWHEGNMGPNSGLDADTLDGDHASSFMINKAGTDLNVHTTAGTYAGTFANNPNGSSAVGTLVVLTHSGTGRTSQIFVDSSAKLFTRYSSNMGSSWSAWMQYGAMEYDDTTNTLNVIM